jgi:hypothetical protein
VKKHMEIPGDLDSLNVLQSIFLGANMGQLVLISDFAHGDGHLKKCSRNAQVFRA